MRDALERAQLGPAAWHRFERAVWHEHNHGTPLLTATNWLTRVGPRVAANIASRLEHGP
ncbi:MAG: hypothetical protein AB7V62_04365 [Thermoleophilia bacterium]